MMRVVALCGRWDPSRRARAGWSGRRRRAAATTQLRNCDPKGLVRTVQTVRLSDCRGNKTHHTTHRNYTTKKHYTRRRLTDLQRIANSQPTSPTVSGPRERAAASSPWSPCWGSAPAMTRRTPSKSSRTKRGAGCRARPSATMRPSSRPLAPGASRRLSGVVQTLQFTHLLVSIYGIYVPGVG